MRIAPAFVLLLALLSCQSRQGMNRQDQEPDDRSVSHIILLIGDGMGTTAVSSAFYFGEGPSVFYRFPYTGLSETSSATHRITDSGAGGTALSCGIKTFNKAIGMDTLRQAAPTIAELLADRGWNTGIISTSAVTHATPASFYAHVESRYMEEEIADQLLDSGLDFFAGGGLKYFRSRRDGRDLVSLAGKKGFVLDTFSLAAPGTLEEGKKYGFLLAPEWMPYRDEGRGDYLPEATSLGIEQLSGNGNPFFLMVEGSKIDKAGHDNLARALISEVLDFEKAIEVALDYAEQDGHTLVVVTADHETGGFSLSESWNEETGRHDRRFIEPGFATGEHTATLVPVFAFGPGAESFSGIYSNVEIFHKMATLAGLGD
jgi:alkaline phosphatase